MSDPGVITFDDVKLNNQKSENLKEDEISEAK